MFGRTGLEPVAVCEDDALGRQAYQSLRGRLNRTAAETQQKPQINRRFAIRLGDAKQVSGRLI